MPPIIVSPVGSVGCRCEGSSGAVCVKGTAATRPGGQVATKVYIKIDQSGGTPPDTPPADAVAVVPDANGDWCGDYVSGADCGTVSPLANRVCVWAEFPGPSYDRTCGLFTGQCQENLPECCPSSSSSSSSSGA